MMGKKEQNGRCPSCPRGIAALGCQVLARGTLSALYAQKKDGVNNSTSEGRLIGSPGGVREIVSMGEVRLDK